MNRRSDLLLVAARRALEGPDLPAGGGRRIIAGRQRGPAPLRMTKPPLRSNDDDRTRVSFEVSRPPLADGEDCLVIIHSTLQADFGRRYELKNGITTIGRGRDNEIVILSDSVSRQHVELERRGGAIIVRDLGSTNGTYINSERQPLTECRLNRGDHLRVGETIFKFLSGTDIENQYHAVIANLASRDGLTNLANRRQLDTALADEIASAHRYGRALALLMIDVDHFKRINDDFGHVSGDMILAGLGRLLLQRLRPSDKVGRYGGEEFCALLPETDLARATVLAETLRTLIADEQFVVAARAVPVTVSIGAAAWEPSMTGEDLYQAADRRLYEAKRRGRNQVCGG
jgi:diguanylate cyclase (GGDEF)-like protein